MSENSPSPRPAPPPIKTAPKPLSYWLFMLLKLAVLGAGAYVLFMLALMVLFSLGSPPPRNGPLREMETERQQRSHASPGEPGPATRPYRP
ncbi:hypothetical protein HNP98_003094 [Hymenobacter sp. 9A]|uniref:Uncharacterized protein n=1 Tax=Hymenobacter caeli TaxID=2735894 RepID=A0ABX2FVA0_9BACT|nr:hypothetical protein [Hymenobacter caeli]